MHLRSMISLLRSLFMISLGCMLFAGRSPLAISRTKVSWIVQKTSNLSIDGCTNFNRFACTVSEYTEQDTIACIQSPLAAAPQGIPLKGMLRIKIGDFNCHNRMMTTEFKKTLRYKQYPELRIEFISLEKMPFVDNNAEIIKGQVDVELAGVCRRFEIMYTSSRTIDADFELVGTRTFGFSDFQLQPPQKMGRRIKVNDRLNVQFILYLKPTPHTL